MPVIPLVDDSEADRKLTEGLLSADLDWLISHASSGAEAIQTITTLPD